jgi:hypothetical protein
MDLRMLVLPTGELLLSDSSNQLYAYTPDGSAPASLRPRITDVNYMGHGRFTLTGRKLNGQSAGASYGDDDQMNENYPIVRLEQPSTGNIYYCRTTHWTSVAVDGNKPERVSFTLNSAVIPGHYELTVVAAGIASDPFKIRITEEELDVPNEEQSIQLPATSHNLTAVPKNTKWPPSTCIGTKDRHLSRLF